MRFSKSAIYNALIGLSLLISGVLVFYVLEGALLSLGFLGFSDPDWPHGYESVRFIAGWLWMMPVLWLVSVGLALNEMRGRSRKKWLVGYAVLPAFGVTFVLGISMLAVGMTTPR